MGFEVGERPCSEEERLREDQQYERSAQGSRERLVQVAVGGAGDPMHSPAQRDNQDAGRERGDQHEREHRGGLAPLSAR